MATEVANIQESECLKKGEREENALASETFEEKVTQLPVNKVKQLETSSQVAEAVNTPLETGKPTVESGSFFQTLSAPMVTADEQSKTPEDKSIEAQEANEQGEDGTKDIEEQKSEESIKKHEQDEEADEIKAGIVMEESAKHEEKDEEDDIQKPNNPLIKKVCDENNPLKVENESSSKELNDKAVTTLHKDEHEEKVNVLEKDQDKAEVGKLETYDNVAPSQHESPIVFEKDQGNSDGVTVPQEAPCVDGKEATTVPDVTTLIDFKERDLNEKPREFLREESKERSLDAQEASEELGGKEEINQKPEESVKEIEKGEEIDVGISTETKSQVEKETNEEEDTLIEDGLKKKHDKEVYEEIGPEKVEYEEVKHSAVAVVNNYEDEDEEKQHDVNVLEKDEDEDHVTSVQDVSVENELQEKNQYDEDREHEIFKAKESIEEHTDVCVSSFVKDSLNDEEANDEKVSEQEVCEDFVPEKAKSEGELEIADSVVPGQKEILNMLKDQGDNDSVTISKEAPCVDVKETTIVQHVPTTIDFEERDLHENPRDFLQEETEEQSLNAQEASRECEDGAKKETGQKPKGSIKKAENEEAEINNGQNEKSDKEGSEETGSKIDEYEKEVKHSEIATVNKEENGNEEKEQDANIENDENVIKKEVCEVNVPENAESEGELEIYDGVAPSQKESRNVLEDQGDNDGVTSSQEAPCVDVKEITTIQQVSSVVDFKEQDLNEKPREFLQEETEETSLHTQEASKECEDGEKEEIEQKPEESVKKIEKEEETVVGISTETKTQVEKTEHEEADSQIGDQKEKPDKELCEETSSEKVKHSALDINKYENEDEEKEQDANVLEKDEDENNVTSTRDVTFEKDLQEKNHHIEDDEHEGVTVEESIKKDPKDIVSGEKTEQQMPINSVPSDVCISTQTEVPEEETTENKSVALVVLEIHEANVSEKIEHEEGSELNLSSPIAQSENKTMKKDHEREHKLYVSEKVQSDGDDLTSLENASNRDTQTTTIAQHLTTVAGLEEGQGLTAVPKDVLIEEANDKLVEVQEGTEQYEDGEQKPEEGVNETSHTSKHEQEEYDEEINPSVEKIEEKDVCISTQIKSQEEAARNEESAIENDGGRKEKSDEPFVKEVCEENDSKKTEYEEESQLVESSNVKTIENIEAETLGVQGGGEVTSSQKESSEDIKETVISQHAKETIIEEAEDKSVDAKEVAEQFDTKDKEKTEQKPEVDRTEDITKMKDEFVGSEKMSLEVEQLNEQNDEETDPCPSKTVTENLENEIMKVDKDLSHESVNDENDNIIEEKSTAEHEPVEVHGGLETSTEGPSSSEKEIAEHVSEVQIRESVPKSEDSLLKEECFISEMETHLEEEKEIPAKEISSDEKIEETTEIKQEATKAVCEETSSKKTELEEGLKLSDNSDIKIAEKEITTFKDEDQEKSHEVNVSTESQGEENITSSQNEVSEEKEALQEKNYHNENNEHDFIKSREGADEYTEEIKSNVETKETAEDAIATNVCSSSTNIDILSKEKGDESVAAAQEASELYEDEANEESEKSHEEDVKETAHSCSQDENVEETKPSVETNEESEQQGVKHADSTTVQTKSQEEYTKNEAKAIECDADLNEKVCEETDLNKNESKEGIKIFDSSNVNINEKSVTIPSKDEDQEEKTGESIKEDEKITDLKEIPHVEPQEDIIFSVTLDTSAEGLSSSEKEKVETISEVQIPEAKEISSDEKTEETTEIKQEVAKVIWEETSSEKTEVEKDLKLSGSSEMKINEKGITAFKVEDREKDHEINVSPERRDEDNNTSSKNEASEEKEGLQEKNYHNEDNEPGFIKSREGLDEGAEEIKSSVERKEDTEDAIGNNVCSSTHIELDKETVEYEEKNGENFTENDEIEIVKREENRGEKQEDTKETKMGEHATVVEEEQSLRTVTKDTLYQEEGDEFVVPKEASELHKDEANEKSEESPEEDVKETVKSCSKFEQVEETKPDVETNEEKEQQGVNHVDSTKIQTKSQEEDTKNEEKATESDVDLKEKLCEETNLNKNEFEEEIKLADGSGVIQNEKAIGVPSKDEDQEKKTEESVETERIVEEHGDMQEKNYPNEGSESVFVTTREGLDEDIVDNKATNETKEKEEEQESLHVACTDVCSSAQKEPKEETIQIEEKNEEAIENNDGRKNLENEENEQEVKIAALQVGGKDVRSSLSLSSEETSETTIDQNASTMDHFKDKEITGEEAEDKSMYAQEASENGAKDNVEQQDKESVNKLENSCSETIEESVKEESGDAGNIKKIEFKQEAENQADKTEDRSEVSKDLVQPKELNFKEIQACLTETTSEKTEDENEKKDEDLSHEGREHTKANIFEEEKCFLDGNTKDDVIPILEHEPVEQQSDSQDEVSKEELTVLKETTAVKPQADIAPSSENLPIVDLESVSEVHVPEVLPRAENSKTKEEALRSAEEKTTATKEISSDENLETHEDRDIKDVTHENKLKSTKDDKEVVEDVVLTEEVEQVPLEIEGKKEINDFKVQTIGEAELEEKSAQNEKEVHEISNSDSIPVENPKATEVNVDAHIRQEDLHGKEDIGSKVTKERGDQEPKEERLSSIEDVANVESQVDLSVKESAAYPSESEKLTVQTLESNYDVQIPEVVADSEDSQVKNTKTDESSSAPDKEHEYVKKASTESDEAKRIDLIIVEKALTKEVEYLKPIPTENTEVTEMKAEEPTKLENIHTAEISKVEDNNIDEQSVDKIIPVLEDSKDSALQVNLPEATEEKGEIISQLTDREILKEKYEELISEVQTPESTFKMEMKEENLEAINNTCEKKLVSMEAPEELTSLVAEDKTNEAVHESDKTKVEQSSLSNTDEVFQIKRSSLRPNEFLETKHSVEDAEDPKSMADNLNVKDETSNVMKGAGEDSETAASEKLENMVTEEDTIKVQTGKEKVMAHEPQAESLIPEATNLEAIKAPGTEPKNINTVLIDQKENPESMALHEPTKGYSEVAGNLIGKRDLVLADDQKVEKEETGDSGVKTDNEDEEDNEDDEKIRSDAPVMVEASKDGDVRAHKKSHNILLGVGSKVKNSIAKVKKAITGKSSPPKSPSAKEKNQVID